MARSDYKSFETNDLHMNALSSDEAEVATLLPADAKNASSVASRVYRSRYISIASVVLACIGVTLLVSFSNGSSSKATVSKGSSVADMHTFESIKAGEEPGGSDQ